MFLRIVGEYGPRTISRLKTEQENALQLTVNDIITDPALLKKHGDYSNVLDVPGLPTSTTCNVDEKLF